MAKHIIALVGNPSEGWVAHGPYESHDHASEAHKGPDVWLMTLEPAGDPIGRSERPYRLSDGKLIPDSR